MLSSTTKMYLNFLSQHQSIHRSATLNEIWELKENIYVPSTNTKKNESLISRNKTIGVIRTKAYKWNNLNFKNYSLHDITIYVSGSLHMYAWLHSINLFLNFAYSDFHYMVRRMRSMQTLLVRWNRKYMCYVGLAGVRYVNIKWTMNFGGIKYYICEGLWPNKTLWIESGTMMWMFEETQTFFDILNSFTNGFWFVTQYLTSDTILSFIWTWWFTYIDVFQILSKLF